MAITPDAQSLGPTAASAEPRSGSLGDVLDVILDKGLVIDAFVRVSLVGIEILTLDARIVVASVDTYMHFAREAHRLEMGGGQGSIKQGLGGMMGQLAEGGAHSITRGALQGAGEGLRKGLLPERQESGGKGIVQRAVGAIRGALDPDAVGRQQAPSDEASSEGGRKPRRQPAGDDPHDSAGAGTAGDDAERSATPPRRSSTRARRDPREPGSAPRSAPASRRAPSSRGPKAS